MCFEAYRWYVSALSAWMLCLCNCCSTPPAKKSLGRVEGGKRRRRICRIETCWKSRTRYQSITGEEKTRGRSALWHCSRASFSPIPPCAMLAAEAVRMGLTHEYKGRECGRVREGGKER